MFKIYKKKIFLNTENILIAGTQASIVFDVLKKKINSFFILNIYWSGSWKSQAIFTEDNISHIKSFSKDDEVNLLKTEFFSFFEKYEESIDSEELNVQDIFLVIQIPIEYETKKYLRDVKFIDKIENYEKLWKIIKKWYLWEDIKDIIYTNYAKKVRFLVIKNRRKYEVVSFRNFNFFDDNKIKFVIILEDLTMLNI